MDGSRGHQLWDVHHQIGRLVLWDPPDRNSHLWKNTLPRYELCEIISHIKYSFAILWFMLFYSNLHAFFFSVFIRYEQPRGDQESGRVIQDAVSRRLSTGAVWHHDAVLEAEAWRTPHFWTSPEHSQRLLHCHGRTIRDAAVMTKRENVFCWRRENVWKKHDLNE